MTARGYLVRVVPSSIDETFVGLKVLFTSPRSEVVCGGISDALQCTYDTAHCPRNVIGWVLGHVHTHLWIAGEHWVLNDAATVLASPAESAINDPTH